MKVIIMGSGRVGEQVARLMAEDGHDVTVIDYDAEALARLGPNFKGKTVQGIGFDRNVLMQAGIHDADAFVAKEVKMFPDEHLCTGGNPLCASH